MTVHSHVSPEGAPSRPAVAKPAPVLTPSRPVPTAVQAVPISWGMRWRLWFGRLGWMPLSEKDVLLGLRAHRPTPRAIVRHRLRLRWTLTVLMAGLIPLSFYLAKNPNQFIHWSAWVIGAFLIIGLMAVVVGFLARRSHGVERQWGLSPLNERETQELMELSARHPAIDRLTGEWLERWVCANSELRGEDLMLLRQYIRAYDKARARTAH